LIPAFGIPLFTILSLLLILIPATGAIAALLGSFGGTFTMVLVPVIPGVSARAVLLLGPSFVPLGVSAGVFLVLF